MSEEDSNAPWQGRRKRIVAREVSPEAIPETSVPAELIERSAPAERDSHIVDPTQFVGVRQRRHGSHVKYRMTQACIAMTLMSAAVAIAMILTDERLAGQFLGGAAVLLAVISVRMVRASRLAYRMRGYAAAAGVLAVLALAASFLPSPFPDNAKSAAEHPNAPSAP